MNQELELTLLTKINDAYRSSLELADTARENARSAINKAVECGQYLIEAKQSVGHGKWSEWFSSRVTDFNQDTSARYMRLADFVNKGGSLDAAASQRQAFIIAGILPQPEREHGSQQAQPEGQAWLSSILKAWEKVSTRIEKTPVDEWPEVQRVTLKEKLRPLAELYQTL